MPPMPHARRQQALRHDRSGGVGGVGEAGGAAAVSSPTRCAAAAVGDGRCRPSHRRGLRPAGAQGIREAMGAVVTAAPRHATPGLAPPPTPSSPSVRLVCEGGKGRSRPLEGHGPLHRLSMCSWPQATDFRARPKPKPRSARVSRPGDSASAAGVRSSEPLEYFRCSRAAARHV